LLAREATTGNVPWQEVEFFFGDERDVPPDHIESNYGMIQRTLLDHLPVPPGHVHPMPADWLNMDAAAEEYERAICQVLPADPGRPPRFDLILLGMGADGHTASLFPFTECLNEQRRLVISHYVPVLGRKRMTFTFPLINAARNVVMLVTGDDKAGAVADLLGEDSASREQLPAARVAPADGRFTLVLDSAAARRLKSPPG
jgi:6-phosphogluconolactonase